MCRIRRTLWFGRIFLILILVLSGCDNQKDGLREVSVAESGPDGRSAEDTDDAERPEDEKKETKRNSEEAQTQGQEPSIICVYVCGKVARTGVYELNDGARIYDAIEAAGGMTEEAASDWLNQAEVLSDGQKVYVPDKEEALTLQREGLAAGTGSESVAQADGGKVNLNTASKEELMTLSGIGEARAESILAYRTEHGRFQSIEEIQQVEGIKSGIYSRIKDKIMV